MMKFRLRLMRYGVDGFQDIYPEDIRCIVSFEGKIKVTLHDDTDVICDYIWIQAY